MFTEIIYLADSNSAMVLLRSLHCTYTLLTIGRAKVFPCPEQETADVPPVRPAALDVTALPVSC